MIVARAFEQARRAAEYDAFDKAGRVWPSFPDPEFIVPATLWFSREEGEEETELLKAQQEAEESEREASRLIAAYTVSAYKLLSTFLFATTVPATAIASLENVPPAANRARFKKECGCAL